jgi:hypothetical protein
MDPVPISLALKMDVEIAPRQGPRDLDVNVTAEIRVRDDADAVRKIAFEGEPVDRDFQQLLGSILLVDLADNLLAKGANHGTYDASEQETATKFAQASIPSYCPLQMVRLSSFTFGDPVFAAHSKKLISIAQTTELTVATIKGKEEIFTASRPLVQAQRNDALEQQRHEAAIGEIPRLLRQENVATAFRQIKDLNLTENELLLYAQQLDPDSGRLLLEHARCKLADNDALLEKITRIIEQVLRANQPRNYFR